MPTATPFTALGRGNGFPFCPARVDVDDFDHWITLGGFKKTDGGSPSQAQIDLSLANAMKIFWNGYAINGTASTTGTSVNSANIASDGTIFDLGNNVITPSGFDGVNRVCWGRWTASKTDESDDFFYVSILSMSASIRRMYVGGDFVGYGVAGYLASAVTSDTGVPAAEVYALSYERFEEFLLDIPYEYEYTSLSSIPVLGKAWTIVETGIDAAALSATTTSGSTQLTSIHFYDY